MHIQVVGVKVYVITLATSPSTVLTDPIVLSSWCWDDAARCLDRPLGAVFHYRKTATWRVDHLQQPVTNIACPNKNRDFGDGVVLSEA